MSDLENLIEELKNDNVIPIIGAGVSRATADIMGWKDLIINGIEFSQSKNLIVKTQLSETQNLLDQNKLVDAATILKKVLRFPSPIYVNWINEVFDNLEIKSKELVTQILSLCTPIILTTNYDTLLTTIDNFNSREKYDHTEYEEFFNKVKKKENCVFHLHGVYTKPETIVLDKKDYNKLQKNKGYTHVISNLISTKTFLFIGCSRDGVLDDDLKYFFKFIQKWFPSASKKHYILLNEKEINNQNNIDFLVKCNIQTVNYGKDYSDLSNFISKINPNLEKRQSEIKKVSKDLKESLQTILKDDEVINQDKIEISLQTIFSSKYDWVSSDKINILENVLVEINSSITEKRKKLIFTQSILGSIINLTDLGYYIDLWAKNSENPKKLSTTDFFTISKIAYQCLKRIPDDLLNDIHALPSSIIHNGFFDGHLGSFISRIERAEDRKIDVNDHFQEDRYMFENLKRIIDSLHRFLELDPDDVYQIYEKAFIAKKLPNEFITFIEYNSIVVRDLHNIDSLIAKIPYPKPQKIKQLYVIKQNDSFLIIGYTNKKAFHWNPVEDIFVNIFFELNDNSWIYNISNNMIGDSLYTTITTNFKEFNFVNFLEIKNNTPKEDKLNKTIFGSFVVNSSNNYIIENNFLKCFDLNNEIIYSLNYKQLKEYLLTNNLNFKKILNVEKPISEKEINIFNNPRFFKVVYKENEIYLLNINFELNSFAEPLSVLIMLKYSKGEIIMMDSIVVETGQTFCFDFKTVNDKLYILSGFLDRTRNNKIAELTFFSNGKFSKGKTLIIERENSDAFIVRDILEVKFVSQNTVILKEESNRLIKYNLLDDSFTFYLSEGIHSLNIVSP